MAPETATTDTATATTTETPGGQILTATESKVVKPGYKTTEFWLKLAAMLVTALYASGAIPTEGAATRIVAMAATILGALGYTVMRGVAKK